MLETCPRLQDPSLRDLELAAMGAAQAVAPGLAQAVAALALAALAGLGDAQMARRVELAAAAAACRSSPL